LLPFAESPAPSFPTLPWISVCVNILTNLGSVQSPRSQDSQSLETGRNQPNLIGGRGDSCLETCYEEGEMHPCPQIPGLFSTSNGHIASKLGFKTVVLRLYPYTSQSFEAVGTGKNVSLLRDCILFSHHRLLSLGKPRCTAKTKPIPSSLSPCPVTLMLMRSVRVAYPCVAMGT
jgi:hypothetical protein